jgi:hypothetical protein
MKNWALTSSIVRDTPYFDAIWPLTEPLFRAYAERHDLVWRPHIVTMDEITEFDTSTAPRGTGVTYAGIPNRRVMLDEFDGVVFMDSDTVICPEGFNVDICTEVSAVQPIGVEPGGNLATMVLLSCDKTRELLDKMWDRRVMFKHFQWLEQAAYMQLMGFDPNYPGDYQPPVYLGDTEWTPLRANINRGWNAHPYHQLPDPFLSLHPGGVQPFQKRLEIVQGYAARAQYAV